MLLASKNCRHATKLVWEAHIAVSDYRIGDVSVTHRVDTLDEREPGLVDGRRQLARAETSAIVVASEEGVGGIGEGVVCVPLALDAGLAHGRIVGLEAVRDRQSATILIPGYS